MAHFFSRALFAVFFLLGVGCTSLELTRAFQGEFSSKKNNKVIGEYCASCHIHKKFDSKQHVTEVRPEYRRRFFRTTTECRARHYLEKRWTHSEVLRKTRRPQEVNRGKFRGFEKKYTKTPDKT